MSRGGQPRAALGAREVAAPVALAIPWAEIAIVLACVAFALWVHRRVLGGFFSLDDLVIMEEMRGLRPHTVTLWRFLSGEVYFRSAVALFGSNPFPYHLMSWLLHGANVALIYAFVRRSGGHMVSATLAAGLFGTTRLVMTAVHAPASTGELAALGLTLGMFLVRGDRGGATLARAGLFGAALLCKEAVAPMPLLLLLPLPNSGPLPARLRRAAAPMLISALLMIWLVFAGAGSSRLGGEAYAMGWGGNLLRNLLVYAAWASDLRSPIPDLVASLTPNLLVPGLVTVVALIAVAIVAWRASRLPASGALWWVLGLLPVLPLLHHTYLHYLYVPCAGLGIALGGWVEWGRDAWGRRVADLAPAYVTAALVGGLVLVHGGISDRLLGARHALRMADTSFPLDPYLRKSEAARYATKAVAAKLDGRHGRVAFLMPASLGHGFSTATGERVDSHAPDTLTYDLLEGALDGGRGLRVLVPGVDSVAFLPGWRAGFTEFEIFGESSEGTVVSLGRGADGYALAAALMMDGGFLAPASELLSGALSESPDCATLRFQHSRALYQSGDSSGMRRELEEMVRRSPDHPLAALVKPWLAGNGAVP